jgi:hypothetical protein
VTSATTARFESATIQLTELKEGGAPVSGRSPSAEADGASRGISACKSARRNGVLRDVRRDGSLAPVGEEHAELDNGESCERARHRHGLSYSRLEPLDGAAEQERSARPESLTPPFAQPPEPGAGGFLFLRPGFSKFQTLARPVERAPRNGRMGGSARNG